jgi:hypothetical protein
MKSRLILNSPWRGTGNRSYWSFSGKDDRELRACLEALDEFRTDEFDDRWRAALIFYFADRYKGPPEAAWTIHGAQRLPDLLPESLADLRDDLFSRFRDDPLLPQFRERLAL